ncbi:glycosyltransferase [Flavobacterium sp. JLP]|uniref:glycosyltransferase family 2 protein n=1 Tax=Flavobacterium sp. JLP TaxID=2783793 RepID=UPI00188BA43A|nr:glycosyltransferase [Flavobacterium sp. JLP]MBF4507136.1 glycosyltransferase [Flavobacterium sp. JLP]
MATYNRSHFILEALSSIQNQIYSNWECLIIDDGGTDNTIEVITPILEQDSRFKFLKRPDNYKKGLPGCRNFGLDLAKGDFIIFFDDDDIVHPDNLKICIEILINENLDFCHYQKLSFEKENPLIEKSQISRKESLSKADIEKIVTQKIGLASCTVMWKKKCFSKIRFKENLLYAEEWECYTRIISNNFKGVMIDAILYYYRKHAVSNTGDFYTNNPISRLSKNEAVLLILKNLKEKQLLTDSIILYFVTVSLSFKEFNLFNKIIKILDLNIFQKFQLKLFYISYPLRMPIYKMKKRFKK